MTEPQQRLQLSSLACFENKKLTLVFGGGPERPPDLLVDEVGGLGHVQGGPDAHRAAVEVSGPDLGHVAAAVHLLVLLPVLVVVVGLEGELGAAHRALETSAVEEGEVLQRTDPVHLVDGLAAPEAGALVEVGPVDGLEGVLEHRRLEVARADV